MLDSLEMGLFGALGKERRKHSPTRSTEINRLDGLTE